VVAQFFQLKLRLISNVFRRSPGQIVCVLIGVLCSVVLAAALVYMLVNLRFSGNITVTRDVFVVGGGLVVLGFFLVPLFVGIEDSMDPRKFSLLGVPDRDLALGLLLAGLVGVPSALLAVILLGTVVTWSLGFFATVVAVVAAGLVLATCVVFSRLAMGLGALFLATRRSREFARFGGVVLLIVSAPIVLLLLNMDWARTGRGLLEGVAAVVGWTPIGAAWAAPGDAAAGLWGTAVVKLLVAGATLALLWLLWRKLIGRMLVSPGRQEQVRPQGGLGWFGLLPHNPIGAIAARSFTYWARDSRYWVSLVIIPIVPIIAVLPLSLAGVPSQWLALVPVPLMCVFLGWAVHNDVAYDSTAIWLHVASGTRGFADRIGRLIPAVAVGIPLIGLGSMVSVAFFDDWAVMPSMLGVSTCIFLTALGLSSFTSARFPYPVTKPGDSPFAQPQASESSSAFTQSLTFMGPIVIALPVFWFAFLGLSRDPAWHVTALIVGVGVGLTAISLGIWAGGHVFERRGPDMLTSAQRA